MTQKIRFISAENGGIRLGGNPGVELGFGIKPMEIAAVIDRVGLDPNGVSHSSSMDFASEEGFDTDAGAWMLWEQVEAILYAE